MVDANLTNLVSGLLILSSLIVLGALGYAVFESTDIFSAFYNVILIITTVGINNEVATVQGRVLVITLLGLGIGLVLYIAVNLAGLIVEGQTRLILGGITGGAVRMKKDKNHIIVCGYGKLGQYVCEQLKEKKQKFLVVDKDASKIQHLAAQRVSVLQGDALDPNLLKKANIAHAHGLIATLGEDSENIYLIMTAADLNPHLYFAAKAEEERAVDRLHKVGAKIVVLPQVVGGRQLADAFLQVEKSEKLETVSKKK